jgi:TolB-like protein/cytochrome c-type biogenesis protein CcmH/NrfG
MQEPDATPTSAAAEPPNWRTWLQRARKPLLVVAGVGTVLGGLAGYVTVYRTVSILGASASAPAGVAERAKAPHPLSIMILPLANQTGDPAKAYLSDGLTAAITGDLSRLHDAVVVPAATALALHERKLTLAQLGSEARVRFVLQGSVVASDDKLRINAQLSDTQAGIQIWSGSFEGRLSDLFALQDQVTLQVRASIGPQMMIAAARESERQVQKPQVVDLLLRAEAIRVRQSATTPWKSVADLAQQALAIEPGNVWALELLAVGLWLQVHGPVPMSVKDPAERERLLAQAESAARQVLQADPTRPDVYNVLASQAEGRHDFGAAEKLFAQGLELSPANNSLLNNLSSFYLRVLEPDKARELLMRALRTPHQHLSPSSRAVTYSHLSHAAFMQGDADEAIQWAQRAVDTDANDSRALTYLAFAYALKGDEASARRIASTLRQRWPELFERKMTRRVEGQYPPGKKEAYETYIETKVLPARRMIGFRVD